MRIQYNLPVTHTGLTAVVNLATVVEQLEEKPLDAAKVCRLGRPRLKFHLDVGQRHRLHLHVRLVLVVVVVDALLALVAVVLSCFGKLFLVTLNLNWSRCYRSMFNKRHSIKE